MKATSLASTGTVLEIAGLSRKLVSETFAPYEIFIAAGMLYLGLTFLLIGFVSHLERLLSVGPRTRTPQLFAMQQVAS